MTDKELLELVAKAAGIELGGATNTGYAIQILEKPYVTTWNPLVDDGDAMCLAVKLKLAVVYPEDMAVVRVWLGDVDIIDQLLSNNPYAATRRAIVLAAAELGKRMK
jgi:hypothetical protein